VNWLYDPEMSRPRRTLFRKRGQEIMFRNPILIVTAAAGLGVISLGSAQSPVPGITAPEANLVRIGDANLNKLPDGRSIHRVNGTTVGLMTVQWPKGAMAEPHNHAVELIVTVASGQLKVMSGGEEFILEPGDVVAFPAWVDHGFEALEDTVTYEAAGPG
jgi:quercetin dioxygenase-like cupin family protein